MTQFKDLVICELDTTHDRSNFRCGQKSLDDYLKKQAKQDAKRRISRIFVATTTDNPKAIAGYYTLSAISIELEQLSQEARRKLPRHPIPAALIGRLAVNRNAQGHGIGKMLLTDAIKRTLSVSENIAIYAMVVDAIDETAEAFYQQYGFQCLESERRLYLPLKSF